MPKSEKIHINPLGFREYDARWIYPKDINRLGIENLGKGLGTQIFDYHLKSEDLMLTYFDLIPDGADGVYSMRDGQQSEDHTYWRGFSSGGAVGLMMEHLAPGE